nr:two-component response regulator ARR0 [Lilium lancifolium]
MRVADQFPVGMRVLAVDDDPVCLRLLDTLLRRCQYDVTVTDRATIALKLLRENKDRFDLVVSDVHMPDMDGFKLLELVGLEMDLPVIMLSADGETKTVMKGVTHGAVDYLLKPVRIEELRNIWQHAIRRRNVEKGCAKYRNADSVDGQGQLTGNLSRKRKVEDEDDEDCCEEDMHESEDPSAQKRARVVWSIELHRKFVAAVNQIGLDKAVPKRILDLMNVEGLTRENVASHLQKYRLYLKRLSAVARQQASMVTALGVRDMPYLPMYSVDGLGDFQGLAASDYTPAFSSYPQNGVLNLTIPTTLGMQGLSRSGMVHFGDSHDTTNPTVINLHKLQYSSPPGNLLHGRPMPLELENFQKQKTMPVNSHLPITLSRGPDSSMSMMRAYACPIASKISLNSSIVAPQHDPTVVRDGQCQVNSGDTKFVNFSSKCNSRQKWEEQKGSHASEPSLLSDSSLNCPLFKHPLLDPLVENKRFGNGLCRIKTDTSMIGLNNISAPLLAQSFKADKSTFDGHLNYKDEFSFETSKMMGALTPNNCNIDDLVKAIIKPEHDDITFIDGGDMGYEVFPLSTCM